MRVRPEWTAISALEQRAELVEDLVVLGKAAGLFLAEQELIAGFHVENSAVAGDELCFDVVCVLDRGRQTGGLGEVISLGAVGDADLHRRRASEPDSLTGYRLPVRQGMVEG